MRRRHANARRRQIEATPQPTKETYGVKTPIVFKRIAGVVFVEIGRRRLRAARRVCRARIARGEPPIQIAGVVETTNDEKRILGAIGSENALRMAASFDETLMQVHEYLDRGISLEDAAVNLGVKVAAVKSWLAFEENATEDVRAAVQSGQIEISAGIELTRAGDATAQKTALATLAETGAKSTRAARTAAKEVKRPGAVDGVSDVKTMRRLLQAVTDRAHATKSEKALHFYDGAENVLKLILGETDDNGKPEADDRLVELLKEVRKAMRAGK